MTDLRDLLKDAPFAFDRAHLAAVVVCFRVRPGQDAPPRSGKGARVHCTICGHEAWRSDTSPKAPPVVCIECFCEAKGITVVAFVAAFRGQLTGRPDPGAFAA